MQSTRVRCYGLGRQLKRSLKSSAWRFVLSRDYRHVFGEWEGQSLKDVQEKDGQRFQQWKNEPHLVKIPGGETLDEVRDRAMAVLEKTIKSIPGRHFSLSPTASSTR